MSINDGSYLGHQSKSILCCEGERVCFSSHPETIRKSGQEKLRKPEQTISKPSSTPLIKHFLWFSLSFSPSMLWMGFLVFLSTIFLSFSLVQGLSPSELIYPNFTASNFKYVEYNGAFLFSPNETFKLAMFNPGTQQKNFYLCIIHVASGAIIWSANRDAPVSNYGTMNLTISGITITDQGGSVMWRTPPLNSSVSSLLLAETGNLILLDQFNSSIWQSFDNPTDTIVIGQRLPVGTSLSGAISNSDLSASDYRLVVSNSDAVLKWHGLTYWKLSMDTSAYKNSNYPVEYMAMNQTGLFLFGQNGSAVVIQMNLSPSDFRIAKLDASGQFIISTLSGSVLKQEYIGPEDGCLIPFVCGRLGLCTDDTASNSPVCSCPSGFHTDPKNVTNCVPSDSSYSLPSACNLTNGVSQSNLTTVSYLMLGYGMEYFASSFWDPVKYGVNLSVCQNLCSGDCSCLGIFYENSSGSCYLVENEMGSLISSSTNENVQLGYIKVLIGSSPNMDGNDSSSNQSQEFPMAALVLLPSTGFFLFVVLGFLWWRRWGFSKNGDLKLGHSSLPSSEDLDAFSIPGLPRRFEYEEIEAATDNFKTQIGSGGFGSVYKGIMPDKILVAVKKITDLGIQGKKEFCTEIAVIGNIHHLNLVKLKGFCAKGRQRLLVYEYMNRGSLDRTLFSNGPVLEWQERVDIALGTARGLAYLHSGCENKIIHCDVKPENILLHDHFQAKISDFGLSKLLSPEQSSLFTTMRGTRGYLAPEWLTSSAISDKTDVYSFGMVLLELVSGRKNCSLRTQSHSIDDGSSGGGHSVLSSGSEPVYFPLFALEMHEQGRYLELADPRLEGRVTSEEVEKLVCVALCCVHEDPTLRPCMVTVVGMLEGGTPLTQPRTESLNFLRFYGRRFAEASMVAGTNGQQTVVLYPQANASLTSISGSHTSLSYISSQQISGPR